MVWVKMTYFHHFFRTIPGVLVNRLYGVIGLLSKMLDTPSTVMNTRAPAVLKVCLTLSLLNANVEYVLPVLCDAKTLYRACFPEEGF